MASVLLLYYHLVREGGFTNDQTVYLCSQDFDPFVYLTVEVSAELPEVDQTLLQQGAAIHLLCDLNDMVGEYESDYLRQPFTKRLLSSLRTVEESSFPEVSAIVRAVEAGESNLDYQELAASLARVYEKYVLGCFRTLVSQ